jgi:hypothetical protein
MLVWHTVAYSHKDALNIALKAEDINYLLKTPGSVFSRNILRTKIILQ